jgi:subtilisin family serine protease
MPSSVKRAALCALLLLMVVGSCLNAQAASQRVVVKMNGNSPIGPVLNLLGATVLDAISGSNLYLLQVPSLPLLNSFTLNLLGVAYIEADTTVSGPTLSTSGLLDTESAADWYRMQPALTRIRADRASKYYDGYGVVVADINSAVDYSHPALRGHLTSGYDFVAAQGSSYATLNQSSASFLDQSSASFLDQSSASFLDQQTSSFLNQSSASFLDGTPLVNVVNAGNPAYGHGTLCAGLIAAVAPRAVVMPLRVFDDNGLADIFTISKAIRYAVKNGASVINLSFGISTNSRTVQEAVSAAVAANVVVTASAGNANSSTPQYPASYASVISVAATDVSDQKGSFSNYGSSISVDAPGVNIISAYPGGYYTVVSGTSFSAPIVAGEAALIRSKQAIGVRDAIVQGTVNIDAQNPKYAGKLGRGRVDVMSGLGK